MVIFSCVAPTVNVSKLLYVLVIEETIPAAAEYLLPADGCGVAAAR
jgi:hypothetical protein